MRKLWSYFSNLNQLKFALSWLSQRSGWLEATTGEHLLRTNPYLSRLMSLPALLMIAALASLACALWTNSFLSHSLAPGGTASVSPLLPPTLASPGPLTLNLASVGSGLEELRSYRAKLTVDFTGARNKQPANGQIESLITVTRQPSALHQSLDIDATIPNTDIVPGVSEFFRLANKIYVKKAGERDWLTFTGDYVSPSHLNFFELDRLITLPKRVSTPPGAETIAGLPVQHYTFNQDDLAEPNIIFEQAQGDLWVAVEGNYVVQYIISATLRIAIPDPKAHIFDEGQLKLHYTLSDINADLTISPPASALTPARTLDELPRLPDAEIISIFPTFIEYTSAISSISATLFYRDELTPLGWTASQADIFTEKARIIFTKEDQTITLLISPVEDRQKIKVLLNIDPQ